MNNYYTYAYLREDRTPYYIGKGKGNRAYRKYKGEVNPPKDKSRIIFLKQNITEEEAFKHEIYMIAVFGRIDLGTGILRNKTNGGEGKSGCITNENTKKKLSVIGKERKHNEITKKKIGDAHRGKVMSEDSRKKMSISAKNRCTMNKETRTKISNSNIKAIKISFIITFVDSSQITIFGIRKWCRDNEKYNYTGIKRLLKGEIKKYKDIIAIKKEDVSQVPISEPSITLPKDPSAVL